MSGEDNKNDDPNELAVVVVREKITRCVRECRFYSSSMDGMECTHPYFDGKGAYENMIISHDAVIPERCPLRTQKVNIVISLAK